MFYRLFVEFYERCSQAALYEEQAFATFGAYRRRSCFLTRLDRRLGERTTPLYQRWRHTEPLDAIENHREQLTRHRNLGQLKRIESI